MNHATPMQHLMRVAACAAAAAVGCALAQAPAPSPAEPSAVVTDAGPAPAHERSSIGAIVIDNAPVRAQRDRDFESPPRRSAKATGRDVLRATTKAKARAELQDSREAEAVELYRRGAGGLTPK